MKKRKLRFWNIPVTIQLDDRLEQAVRINSHVSKSDFVREAVREKLRNLGLLDERLAGLHIEAQNEEVTK
jgi:Arc/MetJ-type ribon-helix-helix transcriptional regulator